MIKGCKEGVEEDKKIFLVLSLKTRISACCAYYVIEYPRKSKYK